MVLRTSFPKILSLTELVNCLTTVKATSASSKAMRISRIVESKSASEITAFPRMEQTILSNLSFSVSNIFSNTKLTPGHETRGLMYLSQL